jgi:hypothetical protein
MVLPNNASTRYLRAIAIVFDFVNPMLAPLEAHRPGKQAAAR